MSLFGSNWIDNDNDYDINLSIPKIEDYNTLKEYENNHHFSNLNDEEYNPMEEYERNIRHFQD